MSATCKVCKKSMPDKRKNFCSDGCLDVYLRNKKSRGATWITQSKGADICRERHGKLICEECKKEVNYSEFETHHIKPIELGGSIVDKNNLQVLCIGCHKIKTAEQNRQGAEYRAELKRQEKLARLKPLEAFL